MSSSVVIPFSFVAEECDYVCSLDMLRDSEKYYLLALDVQPMIDTYLYLGKVYLRLDQPLLAVQKLQEGLAKFPLETCLIQAIARIHEVG